jgi:hypothetical protein
MHTEQEFLDAKKKAEATHMTSAARGAIGRAIALDIGPKVKDDMTKPDAETCLRFYVERKIDPMERIDKDYRADEEVYGVPTDVIEIGRIVSFQAGPGSSIGFDERELPSNVDPAASGTLGAVLAFGDQHYILGSNHAMAMNGRATGAQILFRPELLIDDPDKYIFATVSNHVHLNPDEPNRVDCALAKIPDKFLDRVRAEFPKQIVTSADGVPPDRVTKVARVDESERATGKIVSLNAQPRFDFSFGSFEFENLIMIEGDDNDWNLPFAKPGDSGALVAGLYNDQNLATAIVIGGSRRRLKNGQWKSYTFACSFNDAVDALQKQVAGRQDGKYSRAFDPNNPNETYSPKLKLVFSLPSPVAAKPASASQVGD